MNGPKEELISSLAFYKVERSVEWFEQKQQHSVHVIQLFGAKICTPSHTFALSHVHDVSYRPFSNGNGLFYLHTNQGLFTFEVKTDPTHFMTAYRKLRGDFFPL
ncbi:hypothetical protein [Sporosarcina sp. Te-1]|uniref:hypothetical protein n=1 Tax=Sporosarcina sp. Te-1 TaxID=2818390 RepID=UPI001A9CD60D|nr:hypothetical protein [Sporosarcina sp. Te-1]QTD41316.1 hypothetical protein J3U78_00110 [Sporosarcina sp. Te-1]